MFYNNLMANKKYDPKTIRGISIYQDEKRTVYAPFYSKNGYIMTQSNTGHYINYMVGYLTSLVVFEIVLILSKSVPLSLLSAVLVLIINFLFFYFNFLKKAAVIENYSRQQKENFIIRQARQLEYDRIYTLIICCILLVVIFYFFTLWQKPEGLYLYIIIISGIASAVYGFVNLAILICKRKMDKE